MLLFYLIKLNWHGIILVVPALTFVVAHLPQPTVIIQCSELQRQRRGETLG